MDNSSTLSEAIDVLLVEDNPNDAEFAMRALRRGPTAPRVAHVEDGAKALDYLFCVGEWAARDPDMVPKVILLDLKLPKVDGLEVLRRLKSDPRTRDIPVVVLTSSKEPRDIKQSYASGVNSYVVKPVNFESFNRCLSELAQYWLGVNQPAISPNG